MKLYIKKDDQKLGPFSADELQEQIYSGQLSRGTLACSENGTEWLPVETLLRRNEPVSTKQVSPASFDLKRLRDRKEKTALVWLWIASVPIWILLVVFSVATMGTPLLILGFMWLMTMLGELWFGAYLKTNAVRVSPTQLPELNRVLQMSCQQLDMERPDVYVIQHNVWNAFATKIFGRRMVVLFSGAVDSILLKGDMQQLAWVVGHELGHHWAGHLDLSQKLAQTGGWLFWVNLWHSRRRELTCDRVGLYCAGSLKSSRLALMNATVGAQLADKVNLNEAVNQWQQHRREFFVKYRTFYATHPHLLARLEHLNEAAQEFGMAN